MEYGQPDVTPAESSPAPDPSAGTLTPEQQPQDPSQQPQGQQTVPYARFAQVNQRYRQAEQEAQQARQYAAALQQQIQRQQAQAQQQTGVTLSPEETEAGRAMARIMAHHPELRNIFRAAQAVPALAQGYQQVNGLAQQQYQNYLSSGKALVAQAAQAAGVPVTPQTVDYYEGLVADRIRAMPNGIARWQQGDLSVVRDAWASVKTFLDGFAKPAQQQLAGTKFATQRLPPAPRGTSAGNAVQPEIGKNGYTAQQAERDMHAAAGRIIAQAQTR